MCIDDHYTDAEGGHHPKSFKSGPLGSQRGD
jgi:hypothetical protein